MSYPNVLNFGSEVAWFKFGVPERRQGPGSPQWPIVSLKFRECSSWLSISIFLDYIPIIHETTCTLVHLQALTLCISIAVHRISPARCCTDRQNLHPVQNLCVRKNLRRSLSYCLYLNNAVHNVSSKLWINVETYCVCWNAMISVKYWEV